MHFKNSFYFSRCFCFLWLSFTYLVLDEWIYLIFSLFQFKHLKFELINLLVLSLISQRVQDVRIQLCTLTESFQAVQDILFFLQYVWNIKHYVLHYKKVFNLHVFYGSSARKGTSLAKFLY